MIRLGIFGGTFAPFHLGHRTALQAFLREDVTDQCLVIPSGIPPHKTKTALFTDAQRLEMCRIACEDLPRIQICDREIQMGGTSYTVNTLEWIIQTQENVLPVLYVGSDMLLTLQDWHRPQDIFRYAEIAAFSRTGTDLNALEEHKRWLEQNFENVRCTVYTAPPFPVSSTEIREKWERGEDISSLVPSSIHAYLLRLRKERL